MKSIVISVFAGLGKTTVGKKYKNVCDLQSSPYRCDYNMINENDREKLKYDNNRIANPNWPKNYLEAIKDAMNKFDIVLVPSSLDVRELLIENEIDFIFILPDIDSKEMLLERYKARGNNKQMIDEVMNHFDYWSRNQNDYSYQIEVLSKDKYLEDFLIEKGFINNMEE